MKERESKVVVFPRVVLSLRKQLHEMMVVSLYVVAWHHAILRYQENQSKEINVVLLLVGLVERFSHSKVV